MAKITNGRTFKLTRDEALICRAVFDGREIEDIAKQFFPNIYADINGTIVPDRLRKAKAKILALMRTDKFKDCYDAMVREVAFQGIGKAGRKLVEQIDDPQAWLANKASNDVFNHFGKYVMEDNSNEITVRVEGMPTLGAPATETDDTPNSDTDVNDILFSRE